MLPPKANCGGIGTMTTSLYDISNMSDLSFGRPCVITDLYDAVAYPDYPPPGILHAGKGSAVTLATFGARAVWEGMLGTWTLHCYFVDGAHREHSPHMPVMAGPSRTGVRNTC